MAKFDEIWQACSLHDAVQKLLKDLIPIVGYPLLHYSAMLHYVPWDNWLGKSRSHK